MNQFPIRTVAELTGVPTTTLRAWERRYQLLKPRRTPKGHRLYSPQDIELVKKIVLLLKQNLTISEAIRQVRLKDTSQAPQPDQQKLHWQDYRRRMLAAIEKFSYENLDNLYNDALALYPVDMVTQEVILPLLKQLGDRWEQRPGGIAEEHLFSGFLRNKLGSRIHHEMNRTRGKRLLLACLPDEFHELGILLFGLTAISHGYRILYLGQNLPLQQLALVSHSAKASGIVLSGTCAELSRDTCQQLISLRNNTSLPVFIGGETAARHGETIQRLGCINLGNNQVEAMEILDRQLPAYPAS